MMGTKELCATRNIAVNMMALVLGKINKTPANSVSKGKKFLCKSTQGNWKEIHLFLKSKILTSHMLRHILLHKVTYITRMPAEFYLMTWDI